VAVSSMLLDLDGKAEREASRADDRRLPDARTHSDGSGQAKRHAVSNPVGVDHLFAPER
jgi:hypothetical protein